MADLMEEQKRLYRRYNITLAGFSSEVTNLLSAPGADQLNPFSFNGFVGIALHPHLGNKLDVQYDNGLGVLKQIKPRSSAPKE